MKLLQVIPQFAKTDWLPGSIFATGVVTVGWGSLVMTGSIGTIWPMFGIANQLLASVALCVATTILFNMGKGRYSWTTIMPLSFVATTTLVAGWKSITDNFWPLTQKPETATQGKINVALTAILRERGADILRVHDVKENVAALRTVEGVS